MTPLQRATRNHVIEVANRLRAKQGLPPYDNPPHTRSSSSRTLPASSNDTAGLWYDEMRGVWRLIRKGA